MFGESLGGDSFSYDWIIRCASRSIASDNAHFAGFYLTISSKALYPLLMNFL